MTSTYPPRPDSQNADYTWPPLAPGAPPQAPPPDIRPQSSWGAGRITAMVLGVMLLLTSLALGFGGLSLAFVDNGLRDDDGFLMSGDETFSTAAYAMTSESLEIHADGSADMLPQALLGDAKVTAEANGDTAVFVGVAATADVERYLEGVGHSTVVGFTEQNPVYRNNDGTAPTVPPTESDIWVAETSGTGTQSLTWEFDDGDWTIVVMNADGSRGVSADVSAGATVPALDWVVATLLTMAGIGLVVALVLIIAAVRSPDRPNGR